MPDNPAAHRTGHHWFWLVPAATFLVGLLLGGAVMAATGDETGVATPVPPAITAAPSSEPTVTPRTVTIPVSCEQGLQRARAALSTAGEAVDALRNLDTARLQELLNRLQDAEREVNGLADRCRRQVPDQN